MDPIIYLGIDNCFASKRWVRPMEWARVISDLGLKHVEASADTECDPLYMGNEGKMAVVVDPADAEKALEAIRGSRYGQDAAVIGEVAAADRMQGRGAGAQDPGGKLLLRTPVGGLRVLGPLYGEGLPRIC